MREIKFKIEIDNEWIALTLDEILEYSEQGNDIIKDCRKRQYTGLKDKNGLTEIYEGDIINENGLVKGNIYEINEMDKRETDTVIQGFGTKTWCETVSRAILLGCRYS